MSLLDGIDTYTGIVCSTYVGYFTELIDYARDDLLDAASALIQKRPGRGYRTFLHIECLKFLDAARRFETPL